MKLTEFKEQIKSVGIHSDYDMSTSVMRLIRNACFYGNYEDIVFNLINLSFRFGYIQGYRYVRDKGTEQRIGSTYDEMITTDKDIEEIEKNEMINKLLNFDYVELEEIGDWNDKNG